MATEDTAEKTVEDPGPMVNFRLTPTESEQIDIEIAAAAAAAGAKIKRATYARAALLNYARLRRMEAALKQLAADHPKLAALRSIVNAR